MHVGSFQPQSSGHNQVGGYQQELPLSQQQPQQQQVTAPPPPSGGQCIPTVRMYLGHNIVILMDAMP